MSLEAQWFGALFERHVPEFLRDVIRDYVMDGRSPDDYLEAILVQRPERDRAMVARVPAFEGDAADVRAWLRQAAPGSCWMSELAVSQWVAKGGARGQGFLDVTPAQIEESVRAIKPPKFDKPFEPIPEAERRRPEEGPQPTGGADDLFE